MNVGDEHAPLDTPDVSGGPLMRFAHDAMACEWGLIVVGQTAATAEHLARDLFDEVDRLENELSRFIPGSDVARINAAGVGAKLPIGIEALECLELAARVFDDTHGAFDVTLGTGQGRAPLAIDRATRTACKLVAGAAVDLGGIGKGYAVDRVIEMAREWGIDAMLAHAGQSTVYALGAPRGQAGWSVAIRSPLDQTTVLRKLVLRDRAFSGSGVALHGAHILDPRSGTAAGRWRGAWALAPTAALADALSTAFMVMAADEIEQYCRRHTDVVGYVCAEPVDQRSLLSFGIEDGAG